MCAKFDHTVTIDEVLKMEDDVRRETVAFAETAWKESEAKRKEAEDNRDHSLNTQAELAQFGQSIDLQKLLLMDDHTRNLLVVDAKKAFDAAEADRAACVQTQADLAFYGRSVDLETLSNLSGAERTQAVAEAKAAFDKAESERKAAQAVLEKERAELEEANRKQQEELDKLREERQKIEEANEKACQEAEALEAEARQKEADELKAAQDAKEAEDKKRREEELTPVKDWLNKFGQEITEKEIPHILEPHREQIEAILADACDRVLALAKNLH